MNHKKEWFYTTVVLISLWLVGNLAIVGFSLIGSGEIFGETTFWSAYFVSLAVEFAMIISAGIISVAIFWLFKSILKNK